MLDYRKRLRDRCLIASLQSPQRRAEYNSPQMPSFIFGFIRIKSNFSTHANLVMAHGEPISSFFWNSNEWIDNYEVAATRSSPDGGASGSAPDAR
jgi:hypothetical protein